MSSTSTIIKPVCQKAHRGNVRYHCKTKKHAAREVVRRFGSCFITKAGLLHRKIEKLATPEFAMVLFGIQRLKEITPSFSYPRLKTNEGTSVLKRISLLGFFIAVGIALTAYMFTSKNTVEEGFVSSEPGGAVDLMTDPSTELPENNFASAQPIQQNNLDDRGTDKSEVTPLTQEQIEAEQNERDAATKRFAELPAEEKYQERLSSLEKLIKSEALDINSQVALTRAPPSRRDLIEAQKTAAERELNVNGMTIDIAQQPKISEDRVIVYVEPKNQSLLNELSSIGGVKSVAPIFSGQPVAVAPGRRNPANWYEISLSASPGKVKQLVSALNSFDEVGVAEPAYERSFRASAPTSASINDPLVADQWHLDTAKIKQAWQYLESQGLPAGGDSLTIAVIDSGVDYTHPDLQSNMWKNQQEIAGNGLDDDNNGYVDDIYGVSVLGESYSHSGDPMDDHGHGTHIAGIIAASGANDIGGVGIAYNAKIMAVKAGQYSGILTSADIAEGLLYAVDNGADIINMSFGGGGKSLVEEDALVLAFSQAVLVASAGNDSKPNLFIPSLGCFGTPTYPAAYPWVVGVMSRDENPSTGGALSKFSNWDCKAEDAVEYELGA